jgi:cytochrome d ubiquinol oxidase subunit I
VLFFWMTILFVFWLGSLGVHKAPVTAPVGQKIPVPAGSR